MADDSHHSGFQGPKCWVVTALVGAVIGTLLSFAVPASLSDDSHHAHDEQTHEQIEHDDAHSIKIANGDHTSGGVMVPDPHDDEHANEHDASHGHDDPGAAKNDAEHAEDNADHHDEAKPVIPLWLVIPFAVLLLSIALMPFINEHFWHQHFPDFSFLLGGIVVAYYLFAFDSPYHGKTYGGYSMLHAGIEYYAFIALIGGLFVASGGIFIDVKGRGTPTVNTALLAFGAVIANIVGTTGASVLLIRPFMRMNKGRLKPMHVVFFIFIVSNCGGALTPIGDPPLYLGYLKGVPFQWTLINLWPMWAVCIAMLLAIYFVYDRRIADDRLGSDALRQMDDDTDGPSPALSEKLSVRVRGTSGMICLALIIVGVFIDPMLAKVTDAFVGIPVGPTFQIAVAVTAYFVANPAYHKANEFNFFPVKEVGLLFIGIFATMAPALGYLAAHGDALGLDSPTAYYFGTGSLSGVLDNAPTYLNFLQVAFGETTINADTVQVFLAEDRGVTLLTAISLGAVFFGAMTYIGNGPNFMVKAIAESAGLRMPSFFGYLFRSVLVLAPVLVVIWAIFVR